MNDEHKKITEVEGLPKNEKEYMERLMKKIPWFMTFDELKDYLNHIIIEQIKKRPEPCMKHIFNQILIFFRVLDFQTNLLKARADINRAYVQAISLFLKDKYPDDYDNIIHVAEEIHRGQEMESLKDLPIISQERIMDKVQRMMKKNKEI